MPTVQYTHGMVSCSEFTGVPLITLLELAGADLKNGRFVLAEGGEGSAGSRPDCTRRAAVGASFSISAIAVDQMAWISAGIPPRR